MTKCLTEVNKLILLSGVVTHNNICNLHSMKYCSDYLVISKKFTFQHKM